MSGSNSFRFAVYATMLLGSTFLSTSHSNACQLIPDQLDSKVKQMNSLAGYRKYELARDGTRSHCLYIRQIDTPRKDPPLNSIGIWKTEVTESPDSR
jgi:hypothetical protein